MKQGSNKLEGVISISSKGTGYVAVGGEKNRGQDPEIDPRDLNTALHGDLVEIILRPKDRGRQSAEVSKILKRAKTRFVGVLEKGSGKESDLIFFNPDDRKMYTDILIPDKALHGAKVGQKVFVELVAWKNPRQVPLGKVLKVLGHPGNNDTEMQAIAIDKGFAASLPERVEQEARTIKARGITKEDLRGRRDFREILTFTIDPEDAKDFDDAISFREIDSITYEIGIHIADVTHYVKPGSAIDTEARERGTSVYLVDRTIPMLPEVLSNDLCSLVPNQDRLTMSAVFVLDHNAKVKREWFGQTVIHSAHRFTYAEAEKSIKEPGAKLHRELNILNKLAKKLLAKRFAHGAISLDQEEVKFVLSPDGTPLKVIKKERGDSNKLIEEFMLLANKKVAEVLSKKHKGNKSHSISVYRVHDLPSQEKMADLSFFLESLGHKLPMERGIISTYDLNKLLNKLSISASDTVKDTVHRAVIRSMAKAIYSTKNIGHYGLAFKYYTHFTSPIRRYPDMIIHRLLQDRLQGKSLPKAKLKNYEDMSREASEQERRALDAERASVKYKQVEYMSARKGKTFNGIVSGITEWGMYVEEMETKAEGLVRMRDLPEDFYEFNEKKQELVGRKTKRVYRLGDKVKIKVEDTDLERKIIEYELV